MRKLILMILCFSLAFSIYAQQQVSFSIQGHEDDWQLFMSKNIVEDLSFGKVVFITFTAGDAGHGNLAYGNGKIPYFLAREKGAVYSSKFASDLNGGEVSDIPLCTNVVVNGHLIAKYVYRNNVVDYFLRLPDGLDGNGLPSTGNQSLQKLKDSQIKTITAVDNSTVYNGWNDLTQTIKTIILTEKGTDEQVWMNTSSIDRTYNSDDHSDHYYSSQAAQDAVCDLPWVGIVSWMNYRERNLPGNLSVSEIENASAIFAVYSWSLVESGYVTGFDNSHKRFLPGDYFRITRRPTGGSFSGKVSDILQSIRRKL